MILFLLAGEIAATAAEPDSLRELFPPASQPTAGFNLNLQKIGDAFAAGLKTDPFYDQTANFIEVEKRRTEVRNPPDAADGAEERVSRLKLFYLLTLGEIQTIGSQTDPQKKYLFRKAAELYAARGLIELKELPETDFDTNRFGANLRFLGALAWVMDGGMPDGRCLEDLKFCASHDGDYRNAAQEVLTQVPNEDQYTIGLRAMGKKDFDAAEKAFSQQLKYFPDDFEALRWRGECRLEAGSYQAALEDLDECLKREPSDPYSLEARGHALYRMRRVDEAISAWEAAEKVSADRAPMLREFVRVAKAGP